MVKDGTIEPRASQRGAYEELRPCIEQLAECRSHLRLVRHELDKQRKWLDARSVHLDGVINDLDLFLGDAEKPSRVVKGRNGPRRSRSTVRPDVRLSSARAVPRGDGCWDVYLDALPPFKLPPLLGRLFSLLAADTGRDIGDGLVGFKGNSHLLTELHRLSLQPDPPSRLLGRLTARGLAQAVFDLRQKLAAVVLHGDALIQTRRIVGRRLAVRKPSQPIGADAP